MDSHQHHGSQHAAPQEVNHQHHPPDVESPGRQTPAHAGHDRHEGHGGAGHRAAVAVQRHRVRQRQPGAQRGRSDGSGRGPRSHRQHQPAARGRGSEITADPGTRRGGRGYAVTRSSLSRSVHSMGIAGSSESRTEQYLLRARSIAISADSRSMPSPLIR